MKVGLSYSRCVRDIFDDVVNINDVLVLITRTDFNPHNDDEWQSIWRGYRTRSGWSNPEWGDYEDSDEEMFRKIIRPQEDILDTTLAAIEDHGLNVDEYLPMQDIKEFEQEFNKVFSPNDDTPSILSDLSPTNTLQVKTL